MLICNKLKNVTNDNCWNEKIDILSKSYNSYIGYNFSQMFSYLKILDICEQNITLSLHGKISEIEKSKKEILKKFMGDISIMYKESKDNFFAIICKNQTCSDKLNDLNQIDNYIKNNL